MTAIRRKPPAGAEPTGAAVHPTPRGRTVRHREPDIRSLFAASLGARLAAAAALSAVLWLAILWAIEAI